MIRINIFSDTLLVVDKYVEVNDDLDQLVIKMMEAVYKQTNNLAITALAVGPDKSVSYAAIDTVA